MVLPDSRRFDTILKYRVPNTKKVEYLNKLEDGLLTHTKNNLELGKINGVQELCNEIIHAQRFRREKTTNTNASIKLTRAFESGLLEGTYNQEDNNGVVLSDILAKSLKERDRELAKEDLFQWMLEHINRGHNKNAGKYVDAMNRDGDLIDLTQLNDKKQSILDVAAKNSKQQDYKIYRNALRQRVSHRIKAKIAFQAKT